MDLVVFPRAQRLAKTLLEAQLTAQGKTQPIVTKNPSTIVPEWIRLRSAGGPRDLWEWRVMLEVFIYASDETVAEGNSNLVHSIMLDAAGVGIEVPEYPEAYPWIRKAVHISGPTPLESDEDLPQLEVFRVVTTWHVLPIPS
jgi:hypothetical protein